ncbi:hypothetical protein CCP4SC76_7730011 [Gammaproteobacteria bacterium]
MSRDAKTPFVPTDITVAFEKSIPDKSIPVTASPAMATQLVLRQSAIGRACFLNMIFLQFPNYR